MGDDPDSAGPRCQRLNALAGVQVSGLAGTVRFRTGGSDLMCLFGLPQKGEEISTVDLRSNGLQALVHQVVSTELRGRVGLESNEQCLTWARVWAGGLTEL